MSASSLRLEKAAPAATIREEATWLVEPLLVVQQSPSSSQPPSPSPPLTFLEVEFFAMGWMVFPVTCRTWTVLLFVFASILGVVLYCPPILFSSSPLNHVNDPWAIYGFLAFPLVAFSYFYFRRHGVIRYWEKSYSISAFILGKESIIPLAYLCSIGAYHATYTGDLDKALNAFRMVTGTAICSTHSSGVRVYLAEGRVLYRLGRYLEALESFQAALAVCNLSPCATRAQQVWHSIAQTHQKLHQKEQAIDAYHQAMQVLSGRKLEKHLEYARSLILLAKLFKANEEYDKALDSYQKALDIYLLNDSEFPSRMHTAELCETIGDLQVAMQQSDYAIESFERSAEIRRRSGKPEDDPTVQILINKISELGLVSVNV